MGRSLLIMSVLAALGTAAAQAVGPLISTAGQLYTNRQNLKNQDYWNEVTLELANSAHQREILDLEKAGLNPILSSGGSGSATPSLHAATLQNPTSSFGSSARSIGDALMGKASAEVKQAKADAASAEAYSDRAEELAAAELSEARARSENAWNEAQVSDVKGYADRIDSLARLEALQGSRPAEVNERVANDNIYKRLVQQYRNQVKSGMYKASVGRAIFQDVMGGASSAADIYRNLRGGKSTVNKNVSIRRIP